MFRATARATQLAHRSAAASSNAHTRIAAAAACATPARTSTLYSAPSSTLLFSRFIGQQRIVDGDDSSVSVEALDVAAQAAAKKAAREAKKLKRAEVVAATKNSEREARRTKKEGQRDASMRAEQKFKASVIEKEVPLMDLTGIKPGQNKVTHT